MNKQPSPANVADALTAPDPDEVSRFIEEMLGDDSILDVMPEQDRTSLAELRSMVRQWLKAVGAEQVAKNNRQAIEERILAATDSEIGGLDLHWPLVCDGVVIDNDGKKLTMRHCTQLR